jgi:hypothetical protein
MLIASVDYFAIKPTQNVQTFIHRRGLHVGYKTDNVKCGMKKPFVAELAVMATLLILLYCRAKLDNSAKYLK